MIPCPSTRSLRSLDQLLSDPELDPAEKLRRAEDMLAASRRRTAQFSASS